MVRSCETTSRQYDRYLIRWLSSMDHGLLCKSPCNVFFCENTSNCEGLVYLVSEIHIDWWYYFNIYFLWISFDFIINFIVVINLNSYSVYCFTFLRWFDWKSRELLFSVSTNGFLRYWAKFMSKNGTRWSTDMMCPNDIIPQGVINLNMNLEQKINEFVLILGWMYLDHCQFHGCLRLGL